MNQRMINFVCALSAVAGISFGVGQTVGQDNAQAGATARPAASAASDRAIVRQLKSIRRLLFDSSFSIYERVDDLCHNVITLLPPSERDTVYNCKSPR
jgi:hypothetical protein